MPRAAAKARNVEPFTHSTSDLLAGLAGGVTTGVSAGVGSATGEHSPIVVLRGERAEKEKARRPAQRLTAKVAGL